VLNTSGPGDFFGEIARPHGYLRSASVRPEQDAECAEPFPARAGQKAPTQRRRQTGLCPASLVPARVLHWLGAPL